MSDKEIMDYLSCHVERLNEDEFDSIIVSSLIETELEEDE